ncbi:transporter substrate-binding domain-containing protein [Arthrobacter roseus]|uniref:transporter substrate-binding domain-containing protein n=1 Tax=Arthrobacter roseus TaxID=136274 RepID=UPI0019633FC1|nr:transporter substrate-binding domain-containing protein [Arthrobacter roseus]MBM7847189.1 ABC-type amino acid transport substrate-binding protein [Arthrobacter roseus]
MFKHRPACIAVMAILLLMLSACSHYPADPDKTLEKVTDGTIRVGVTENQKWVQLEDGTEPQGIEPDLLRDFASQLNADVEWHQGSEHELVQDLKHDELDVVIGGIAGNTPWTTHAGLSRPYVETKDERGTTVQHVMLVPLGENAFLLRLDKFLQAQEVRP